MTNTRGFKVCRAIGGIFILLSIFTLMMFLGIDPAMSTIKDLVLSMVLLFFATALFGFIGLFMYDVRRVMRIIVPSLILFGSILYETLRLHTKTFRKCYLIKQRSGSYRCAYNDIKLIYDMTYGIAVEPEIEPEV